MSHSKADHLVKMLNQIADNNQCDGDSDMAAEMVANHVRKFWAKSMKSEIAEFMETGGEGLNDVAANAVKRLQP